MPPSKLYQIVSVKHRLYININWKCQKGKSKKIKIKNKNTFNLPGMDSSSPYLQQGENWLLLISGEVCGEQS